MLWIFVGLIALIIAYVLDMGLLIYAIYAVAAVILLSRWMTRQWADNLNGQRHCDRLVAEVGEVVTIMDHVENNGSIPIAWCLIEDLLPAEALFGSPPPLDVLGNRIALMRLGRLQKKQLMYQLRCHRRGYYQIGPLVMETGDFFGLHRRFRVVSQPNYVMVLPKTIPLDGYEVASKRPIGEVKMSYRIYEDPTRIAGIRRYQSGDPLNRVHWRATARTGQLHSKMYEPSTIAGATLLLDFHQGGYAPAHEPFRSELAITNTASIAHALYQMSQQIGLITNGRDAADRIKEEGWASDARTRDEAQKSAQMDLKSDRLRPIVVPTTQGVEQFKIILETLARLELTDGLTFPQLILETAPRIPRDATVIAVISKVTPEVAVSLGNLARQGYTVSAIVNVYSVEEFAEASGPLIAEGVETRHLVDEASISEICRRQAMLM